MKKNRIILLIALILGGIAYWLVTNNKKSTLKEELRDFAVADTASIDKIFMADNSGANVTLIRTKPGEWKVNDKHRARKDAIQTLLATIKNLEVLSPVPKNAQENIIKNLATSSVKVEIYQHGQLAKVYYVGGETQDQEGTYMLLFDHRTGLNSSVPFIMALPGFHGYLTPRYFIKESDWREKMVFGYNPSEIQSVRVELKGNPQNSFEVFNYGNNSFELKNISNTQSLPMFDTLAVKQYLNYFQNIQYESLENNIQVVSKDSILNSPPLGSISVTDKKGDVNKVVLFSKQPQPGKLDIHGDPLKYDQDRLYASINNGEDFVLIQYYVFGKLMPEISYFQSKPRL